MANYIVPQVLINQLISEVPFNTIRNQNVLVIGPNYQLFRFAEEKDKTYIGEYINSTGQEGGGAVVDEFGDQYVNEGENENLRLKVDNLKRYPVIPYPNQASATIPDAGYTKLFADEVLIKLASLGNFYFWDDPETQGMDARFRFPYALTGDKRGYATKIVRKCTEKAVNGVKEEAGHKVCPFGCGVYGYEFWEISWDSDHPGSIPGYPGRLRTFPRSLNPGDAIRIPYEYVDENGDIQQDVYRSTIVELFESVPGSGIVDCVQLADTLPSTFPIPEKKWCEADPDDEYSIAYQYQEFETVEDPTAGPVPGSSSYEGCEDSNDWIDESTRDPMNCVQLCAQFSDVEIARKTDVRHVWNWDTYADTEPGNDEDIYGVVITGNLKARYSNWLSSDEGTGKSPEYRVLSAKLFVEHRDLVVATAGDIMSISSHTLVEPTLGTLHPDNPLAFGTYMAALNSGDKLVYYVGISTDDLAGYNQALAKASLTTDVYIITPTTMDLQVIQSVEAHVKEMSTAINKSWRIGFVAMDPPDIDMIYDHTNQPSGEDFYAMFKPKKDPKWDPYVDGYNILQFMWDENKDDDRANRTVKFLTELRIGDVVRIWLDNSDDDWDETPHYTERYVKKIISNNVVQLAKPVRLCADESTIADSNDQNDYCWPDFIPPGKQTNHFKVEVYRKLDPTDQVKYIAAQSSSLATRRMYNVFPSIASNAGVSFDGSFLACAAAGLVSSVLPQQPVTNVEINGVEDIPIVYQTYNKQQLNDIAAGGTFIIMQDMPNGKVYVRHQISTDYTSNNLLKAELSITKNLDSISYFFAERFAPYIGRYNITPELIETLRSVLDTGLTFLETATAAGLYGPQVLEEGTEILELHQNEALRDHVYAKVHLNLPIPFNYFDLDLEI